MARRQNHDPFKAIRIPEYKNLMAGRFLFIMGLRMMGTLVGWWIYELTNDPLAIGIVGLSEVIPAVSFCLVCRPCDRSQRETIHDHTWCYAVPHLCTNAITPLLLSHSKYFEQSH